MRTVGIVLVLAGLGCQPVDRGGQSAPAGGAPGEPSRGTDDVSPEDQGGTSSGGFGTEDRGDGTTSGGATRRPGTDDVEETNRGTNGTTGTMPGTTPGTMPGTTPGAPGTAATPAAGQQDATAKVLSDLHQLHVHEIAMGRLAQQKATAAPIKAYAETLVTEHTADDGKLVEIARTENITLTEAAPSGNAQQLATYQRLQGLQGAQFDQAFTQEMINGHQKAIEIVRTSLTSVTDPEVKSYLQTLEANLQEHLDQARALPKTQKGT